MAFATRNAKYTYSSVKKGGKKKKGRGGVWIALTDFIFHLFGNYNWQILFLFYSPDGFPFFLSYLF